MSEPRANSARAAADEVLQEVTDRIVAALKEKRVPWRRPWRVVSVPLRYVGLPFMGANSLILSLAADDGDYDSPYWLTKAQGRECGGTVKDGQEGTRVLRPVFSAQVNPRTGRAYDFPLMKPYEVFNAEQFDKLPPRFRPEPRGKPTHRDNTPNKRIPTADAFFEAVRADITYGGDEAFYQEDKDMIQMPPFDKFDDSPSYYGTLAHELIHWTGHRNRMHRKFGKRFRDKDYAAEELVAELGSVFVMGRLSLPYQPKQSASYIADWAETLGGWVDVLTGDKRAFYKVAAHAQRAADYLTIAAKSDQVQELRRKGWGGWPCVAIYLDIVEIGSHPLVVAVGVDRRGSRAVLGMDLVGSDSDQENQNTIVRLLYDLKVRGLSRDRRRLFVTDGSALLRMSVEEIFGSEAVIQACREHREREVLGLLPAGAVRDSVEGPMRQAWERGMDGGSKLLARMADNIERRGYKEAAARLRENLDDLFLVDRYKLHPSLTRSLTTTRQIDRVRSGLRRQICGVAKWPNADVALWWAAASFLATERGWPRIVGHRHLQDLLDRKSKDLAVRPPPVQDYPIEQ